MQRLPHTEIDIGNREKEIDTTISITQERKTTKAKSSKLHFLSLYVNLKCHDKETGTHANSKLFTLRFSFQVVKDKIRA